MTSGGSLTLIIVAPSTGHWPLATDWPPMNLLSLFKKGLTKTSRSFSSLFTDDRIDDGFWEELCERLIMADAGEKLAVSLLSKVKKNRIASRDTDSLVSGLVSEIEALFPAPIAESFPKIIVILGVNGSGKTTTIAKLAHLYQSTGRSVALAAADTFRAAAIDQLVEWGKRLNIPVTAPKEGSDPAACAFDASAKAKDDGTEVLLIDTAGRLHTKSNLMEELKKIVRVAESKLPNGGTSEKLLVLDGTLGQNSLTQAKIFHEAVGVTGAVITKLDGTAKGAVVMQIAETLSIPIKYVGLGEGADDLIPFEPRAYAEALFKGF